MESTTIALQANSASVPLWFWGASAAGIFALFALDLGMLHKSMRIGNDNKMSLPAAIRQHLIWVAAAALFAGILFFLPQFGPDSATLFGQAYLTEFSLSVDNLFVFLLIFSHFNIRPAQQTRILFWGILGALIMRIPLLLLGVWLTEISEYFWAVFGLLLVFGIYRILNGGEEKDVTNSSKKVNFILRFLPFSPPAYREEGYPFFVRKKNVIEWLRLNGDENGTILPRGLFGHWLMTPLFSILVLVELTDFIFALDSIPAVIGIFPKSMKHDTEMRFFIAVTSNIFAILGLRTLFFVIEGIIGKFQYLKYGLAALLSVIAAKLLLNAFDGKADYWEHWFTPTQSLAFSIGAFIFTILFIHLGKKLISFCKGKNNSE